MIYGNMTEIFSKVEKDIYHFTILIIINFKILLNNILRKKIGQNTKDRIQHQVMRLFLFFIRNNQSYLTVFNYLN